MNKEKVVKLMVSVIVCLAAGSIGSIFTTPAIDTWYATLQKPSFNPPNWIFGPVWTTLFILMGIAFYFLWHNKAKGAMAFFLIHLALNIFWSIIFFGLHQPFLAFLEIIILWGMILTMVIWFWRIDKRASYLLIPYLLWVSFASVLNFTIWRLNV